MARSTPSQKALSILMAVTVFLTGTALPHAAENNFWKKRALAMKTSVPLPARGTTLPRSARPSDALPKNLGRVVSKKSVNGSGLTVLYIQDVHQNPEAQKRIAQTIIALRQHKAIDMVGLEGSFGPLNLDAFRSPETQEAVKQAADVLFRELQIGGPLHAALSHPKTLGGLSFVGVDDPAAYKAHVDAYKRSRMGHVERQKFLREGEREIEQQKRTVLNPELAAFDREVQRFRNQDFSFGSYVRLLLGKAAKTSDVRQAVKFKAALELESELKFEAIESERTAVLKEVMPVLSPAERRELGQASADFRAGRLSASEFYLRLKSQAEAKRLSLDSYPHFTAYVKYLSLAESINAVKLLDEVRKLEARIYGQLIRTPREKELIHQSRQLHLSFKLSEFSLSSAEWNEIADNSSVYGEFYRQARRRDSLMAENLIRAMRDQKVKSAVLVAGGFHTRGVEEDLAKAGVSVTVFTPLVTKISSREGSRYLSVFTREKSPLEKVFEGERLFLVPPVWTPVTQGMTASLALAWGFVSGLTLAQMNRLAEVLQPVTGRVKGFRREARTIIIEAASFNIGVRTLNGKPDTLPYFIGKHTLRSLVFAAYQIVPLLFFFDFTMAMLLAVIFTGALVSLFIDVLTWSGPGAQVAIEGLNGNAQDLLENLQESLAAPVQMAGVPSEPTKPFPSEPAPVTPPNPSNLDHWKNWDVPTDTELQEAQQVIDGIREKKRIEGSDFLSRSYGESSLEKNAWRRSRTLRALYYLEPDVTSLILFTSEGTHGRWQIMLAPETGEPGIEIEMIGQILARTWTLSGQVSPVSSGGIPLSFRYDRMWMIRLLGYLKPEHIQIVLNSFDDARFAAVVGLLATFYSRRGAALTIAVEQVRSALRLVGPRIRTVEDQLSTAVLTLLDKMGIWDVTWKAEWPLPKERELREARILMNAIVDTGIIEANYFVPANTAKGIAEGRDKAGLMRAFYYVDPNFAATLLLASDEKGIGWKNLLDMQIPGFRPDIEAEMAGQILNRACTMLREQKPLEIGTVEIHAPRSTLGIVRMMENLRPSTGYIMLTQLTDENLIFLLSALNSSFDNSSVHEALTMLSSRFSAIESKLPPTTRSAMLKAGFSFNPPAVSAVAAAAPSQRTRPSHWKEWENPSEVELAEAESYLASIRASGAVEGDALAVLNIPAESELEKAQRRARLLRAIYFLEPDMAGALLMSSHGAHGYWKNMFDPQQDPWQPAIEPDMVGQIINRGWRIAGLNYTVQSGGQTVTVPYDQIGMVGMLGYLRPETIVSILEPLEDPKLASVLSFVVPYYNPQSTVLEDYSANTQIALRQMAARIRPLQGQLSGSITSVLTRLNILDRPAHWRSTWPDPTPQELERAVATLRTMQNKPRDPRGQGWGDLSNMPEAGKNFPERARTFRAIHYLDPTLSGAIALSFRSHGTWKLLITSNGIEPSMFGAAVEHGYQLIGVKKPVFEGKVLPLDLNIEIFGRLPGYLDPSTNKVLWQELSNLSLSSHLWEVVMKAALVFKRNIKASLGLLPPVRLHMVLPKLSAMAQIEAKIEMGLMAVMMAPPQAWSQEWGPVLPAHLDRVATFLNTIEQTGKISAKDFLYQEPVGSNREEVVKRRQRDFALLYESYPEVAAALFASSAQTQVFMWQDVLAPWPDDLREELINQARTLLSENRPVVVNGRLIPAEFNRDALEAYTGVPLLVPMEAAPQPIDPPTEEDLDRVAQIGNLIVEGTRDLAEAGSWFLDRPQSGATSEEQGRTLRAMALPETIHLAAGFLLTIQPQLVSLWRPLFIQGETAVVEPQVVTELINDALLIEHNKTPVAFRGVELSGSTSLDGLIQLVASFPQAYRKQVLSRILYSGFVDKVEGKVQVEPSAPSFPAAPADVNALIEDLLAAPNEADRSGSAFIVSEKAGAALKDRRKSLLQIYDASPDIAAALMASMGTDHIAAWRDLFFPHDQPAFDITRMADLMSRALTLTRGQNEVFYKGNAYTPLPYRAQYIVDLLLDIRLGAARSMLALLNNQALAILVTEIHATIQRTPEKQVTHNKLIGLVQDMPSARLAAIKPLVEGEIRKFIETYEIREIVEQREFVEKSIPKNTAPPRVGPLVHFGDDPNDLQQLLDVPSNAILALPSLPTSDTNVKFQGLITFSEPKDNSHEMERALDLNAPLAAMNPIDVLNLSRSLKPDDYVYYEVTADQVILRKATRAERRKYPPQDMEYPEIKLPAVQTTGLDVYLAEGSAAMSDPRRVGYKAAMLNQRSKDIPPLSDPDIQIRIAGGSSLPFNAFPSLMASQPPSPEGKNVDEVYYEKVKRLDSISDEAELKDALNEIRALIQNLTFETDDPFWNVTSLTNVWKNYMINGVYVRDSNNAQNIPNHPGFGAGIYLTVQNVIGRDAMFQAIKDVWADTWSWEAYSYRKKFSIDSTRLHPPIWFSASRPQDYAFVIHTSDVLKNQPDYMVVCLVQGLGEAIVSDNPLFDGQPTRIVINKKTREVVSAEKATMENKSIPLDAGGTVAVEADPTQDFLELSAEDVDRLVKAFHEMGTYYEKHADHPRKIEGALSRDPKNPQKWTIWMDQEDAFYKPGQGKKKSSALNWINLLGAGVVVVGFSGAALAQADLWTPLLIALVAVISFVVHEGSHQVDAILRGQDGRLRWLQGGFLSGGVGVPGASGVSGIATSTALLAGSVILFFTAPSLSQVFMASAVINLIYAASPEDWKDFLGTRVRGSSSVLRHYVAGSLRRSSDMALGLETFTQSERSEAEEAIVGGTRFTAESEEALTARMASGSFHVLAVDEQMSDEDIQVLLKPVFQPGEEDRKLLVVAESREAAQRVQNLIAPLWQARPLSEPWSVSVDPDVFTKDGFRRDLNLERFKSVVGWWGRNKQGRRLQIGASADLFVNEEGVSLSGLFARALLNLVHNGELIQMEMRNLMRLNDRIRESWRSSSHA